MKKKIILEAICFLFILLFIYAAVSKLQDVQKFRVQLGQSPLLTEFAGLVVWLVPIAEIMISLLLVFQGTRHVAMYLAFTLMMTFTFYIIAITQFSTYIPCSCGGILQNMGWTEHLIFNLTFDLLGVLGIIMIASAKEKLSKTESEILASA